MIKRLRTKFIRIAMLSVALVLLALSLIVNAANFISTNRDLNQTLDMIYENQGTIPTKRTADTEEANAQLPDTAAAGEEQLPPEEDHTPPELEEKPDSKPSSQPDRPRGPFNAETPYSTRYFYLRFDADGDLDSGNFSHIAAVTEDDADTYIKAALQHGAGYGFYTSGYKFRVVKEGENRYIAVFLDCYQELRAVRTLAVWSGVSFAVCLALVYVLVVLLSRRAIDPVVKASEQQKQFITDAGHELKTPITVIATNLRVLEMEVGQQNGLIKPERRPKSCGSWCSRSSRSANMTRRPHRCIRRPSPSARLSRTRRSHSQISRSRRGTRSASRLHRGFPTAETRPLCGSWCRFCLITPSSMPRRRRKSGFLWSRSSAA